VVHNSNNSVSSGWYCQFEFTSDINFEFIHHPPPACSLTLILNYHVTYFCVRCAQSVNYNPLCQYYYKLYRTSLQIISRSENRTFL
jgi:hypothetical protein